MDKIVYQHNQDKEKCFIAQLPKDVIPPIGIYLTMKDIKNWKQACKWTNDNIDTSDILLYDKKKTELLTNSFAYTETLRYCAHQLTKRTNIFLSGNLLPDDFTEKTNNLIAKIHALKAHYPEPEENPQDFKDLIAYLQDEPSGKEKIAVQAAKTKKLLFDQILFPEHNHISTINRILSKYNQFPDHGEFLELLCCLGDQTLLIKYLAIDNRGIDYCENGFDPHNLTNHHVARQKKTILNNFTNNPLRKTVSPTTFYYLCMHRKHSLLALWDNKKTKPIKSLIKKENKNLSENNSHKTFDDNLYKTFQYLLDNQLFDQKDLINLLNFSCEREGNIDLAQLALQHVTNINDTFREKPSPLFSACKNHQTSSGNLNRICESGKCNHLKLVLLFFSYGADPNLSNKYGSTPLHVTEDPKLIHLLLDNRADVNALGHLNMTPLHALLEGSGNLESVELLLKNGANPNSADKNGRTPLKAAQYLQFEDLSKKLQAMLVKYGATYKWDDYIPTFAKFAGITIISYIIYTYFFSESE
jgi:ankyrin repeat protein